MFFQLSISINIIFTLIIIKKDALYYSIYKKLISHIEKSTD
jgi:hypothetical protein